MTESPLDCSPQQHGIQIPQGLPGLRSRGEEDSEGRGSPAGRPGAILMLGAEDSTGILLLLQSRSFSHGPEMDVNYQGLCGWSWLSSWALAAPSQGSLGEGCPDLGWNSWGYFGSE